MAATIVFDTDLAINFKRLITRDDSIKFDDSKLKTVILNSKDNDFLLVKKKIGSDTTIMSVRPVNDRLINDLLFS